MNIELQSMAIDLPRLAGAHPNRAPFHGVLTLVDTPSDAAPAGARGHRVLLTRAAAEQALPSLLGMALDYSPALDRHDSRRKVGIITEANVVDSRLQDFSPASGSRSEAGRTAGLKACSTQDAAPGTRCAVRGPLRLAAEGLRKLCAASAASVTLKKLSATTASRSLDAIAGDRPSTDHARLEVAGFLYARDFPEVMRDLRRQFPAEGGPATCDPATTHLLGMSYEITDASIDDLSAAVWTVSRCIFTGAAMLRRDKAAYRNTWIELIG